MTYNAWSCHCEELQRRSNLPPHGRRTCEIRLRWSCRQGRRFFAVIVTADRTHGRIRITTRSLLGEHVADGMPGWRTPKKTPSITSHKMCYVSLSSVEGGSRQRTCLRRFPGSFRRSPELPGRRSDRDSPTSDRSCRTSRDSAGRWRCLSLDRARAKHLFRSRAAS
jgi:hypothetical protein